MKICHSAICEVGKVREKNEDACAFAVKSTQNSWQSSGTTEYLPLGPLGCIQIVADGMGGENAGEVASSLAVLSVQKSCAEANLDEIASRGDAVIERFIKQILMTANEDIQNHAALNPESLGMGTTMVIVWTLEKKAHVAWCGDSRCYFFDPVNGLQQITKDHSYVQSLVDKHELTSEEAFGHPDSNYLVRCLGDIDIDHTPDYRNISLFANSSLLLCSDGLCGYCSDKEIEDTMLQHFSEPNVCTKALYEQAMAQGGRDNITILLSSLIEDGASAPKITLMHKISKFFKHLF